MPTWTPWLPGGRLSSCLRESPEEALAHRSVEVSAEVLLDVLTHLVPMTADSDRGVGAVSVRFGPVADVGMAAVGPLRHSLHEGWHHPTP